MGFMEVFQNTALGRPSRRPQAPAAAGAARAAAAGAIMYVPLVQHVSGAAQPSCWSGRKVLKGS